MTKQEQVKAIFIEEAGEIIEKLDVDIIRFEENSTDFDLLNEIFRGVHTLKGNANAFGFTRLGEFVHHFEDVLDYYRSSKEAVEPQYLSLMVDSVEVIKDVMICELDALPDLPDDYTACLENIIKLLALKKNGGVVISHEQEAPAVLDLASEFAFSEDEAQADVVAAAITRMQQERTEGLNLFRIELMLDTDCYKRGFDHIAMVKLLAHKAKAIESFFEFQGVGTLGEFETDVNAIKKVTVIALTDETSSEVSEYFEFLMDNEYKITLIDPIVVPVVIVAEQEIVPQQSVVLPEKEKQEERRGTERVTTGSTIRIDTLKLDELFD